MERQRRSPPKHRHDGTSPLPLGMDWSPPPKKWNGRDTVWPHDSQYGWSYCVTIPTWVVLPKSRDSDSIVFYRVQVGLQSPKGITTTRAVLRRFNDFLKLLAALRKAFPKKNFPPAPPKGLLKLKSKTLLEERRCSLEEWITKLLSDIDISRSIVVASFLELESAARSSFQDENGQIIESTHNPLESMMSNSTQDYGSDTAYENSEVGTSSLGRDNISETGTEDLSLDEDLTGQLAKYGISNIDEGLFMGNTILEQVEGYSRRTINAREMNNKVTRGSKVISNYEKLPNGSFKNEGSSLRGSLSLDTGFNNNTKNKSLNGDSNFERSEEVSSDLSLILPLDQQQNMNRIVMSMQRRLGTAKTDMEDLISRLNQEIAVKDYLTTKVKDLEEELESTKQRSKENLEQAILMERERLTQMQWDMEELRRKSLEMEFKLKSNDKQETESSNTSVIQEKDELLQELNTTKKELDHLLKKHQDLEAKSKADVKVLVKEVKSLRSSQANLKQQINQSLEEKSNAEKLLEQEKEKFEKEKIAKMKLLQECEDLHHRLKECSLGMSNETEDKFLNDSSSVEAAFELLQKADDQIEALLAEAQNLSEDDNHDVSGDYEVKTMMSKILVENITLRKQLGSVIRYALKLRSFERKDNEGLDTR